MRYREDEERTADFGELPPEPIEEGKKRRKRIPLVTWHPPERSNEPEQQEIDLPELEEEIVIETDEQRFLRELEETCAVDAVLTRIVDLDAGFIAFQAEQLAAAEAAAQAAASAAQVAEAAALLAEQAPPVVVECLDKADQVSATSAGPVSESPNVPVTKRSKRRKPPPAPTTRKTEQFHGTISNDESDDSFFDESPAEEVADDDQPPAATE